MKALSKPFKDEKEIVEELMKGLERDEEKL